MQRALLISSEGARLLCRPLHSHRTGIPMPGLVISLSCLPHQMTSMLRGKAVFVLASVRLFQVNRMSSGSAPEIRSVGVIVELVTPVFWQARRIRMERAGRFCIWCKVRFTELCAERSSLVGRPHLSRRPGRRVPSWSSFCR